jgi:hypothetical protein
MIASLSPPSPMFLSICWNLAFSLIATIEFLQAGRLQRAHVILDIILDILAVKKQQLVAEPRCSFSDAVERNAAQVWKLLPSWRAPMELMTEKPWLISAMYELGTGDPTGNTSALGCIYPYIIIYIIIYIYIYIHTSIIIYYIYKYNYIHNIYNYIHNIYI